MKINLIECRSCPFRKGGLNLGITKMNEIVGYLIGGENHLCHSDRTNHTICRGGRDYQLEIWHRVGMIDHPTDDALSNALTRSGLTPGGHIENTSRN